MSSRVVGVLAASLLAAAVAAGARAEEPKVYRWVGQDGHVYTSNTPPPNGAGLIEAKPARQAPAAQRASVPNVPASEAPAEGELCGRYDDYVRRWRGAQRTVESWEETIDRIQSRTDDFVRRDETTYTDSLDRANERLDEARERASRIESEGRAGGMPQSCLSE